MEIFDRLDDVSTMVETAKAVPLSQSCVVPRLELLDLIDDVRVAIPDTVREADLVLRRRDDILADARRETDALVASARAEVLATRAEADDYSQRVRAEARSAAEQTVANARAKAAQLVDAHAIASAARSEAAHIIAEARAEAQRILTQTEAQSAALMASTEDALDIALAEVRRRRAHLRAAAVAEPMPPTSHNAPVYLPPAYHSPTNDASPQAPSGARYADSDPWSPDEFFDLESAGGLDADPRWR